MARTASYTVAYRATINMGNYESISYELGETIDLEPGDDPVHELNALDERVRSRVERRTVRLREIARERRQDGNPER